MFVKKVFRLVNPFSCEFAFHYFQKIFIRVLKDPKNFLLLFCILVSKYPEFYADYKSEEIIGKTGLKKLLQVVSIEEDKLNFAHFLHLPF
jgi:hypothetical protein